MSRSMSKRAPFTRARRLVAVLAVAPVATGAMLVGGAISSSTQAAEVRTWERLANCESGLRWHIATGNGYFGGLQFSDPTWDAYSAPRKANRADNARKRAQITTAEKVLDNQGWGAWPACSSALGLGRKEARGRPYDHRN
jgi:resuscitation-promoting factor RpfA